MISLLFPFTVSALSATTANTIKGTEPYLTFDSVKMLDLNKLLSFKLPNSTEITPSTTGKIHLLKTEKFEDVLTLVRANGSDNELSTITHMGYDDDDGDLVASPLTSGIVGKLKAEWSYQAPDGLGGMKKVVLSDAEISQVGNACYAPYTLTITATGVKAQSAYGSPLDSTTNSAYVYGTSSKSYTINIAEYKACYAKPNSMTVLPTEQWQGWDGSKWSWNSGSSSVSASGGNGGGYSSDFDPLRGFKVEASTKFPTTGFLGAKFRLVMSNEQSSYTYALQSGNGVTVDASTGDITFTSKPSGSVTVRATPTVSGFTTPVDYTFNPTTVWALPQSGLSDYPTAVAKCGNESNVLTRAELTNSPRNNVSASWTIVFNRFFRAIGGGVTNEWGKLEGGSGKTYPNSSWILTHYWTKEHEVTRWYVVYVGYGEVNYNPSTFSFPIACRG